MSPEQWKRSKTVDTKTDIWAIGVTLIDAAGGRPWGKKEAYEIQGLLSNGKLPDLSSLDARQKALVSVMLIPVAEERWSATQILKKFDSFYNYKEAPAAAQVKVEARPIINPAKNNQILPDNIKVEGNRVVVGEDVKPAARKVAKNPYSTSDGVPIFIGMRVKYIKTDELGRVTKLDKNDTGYVFVQLDGESESKVKSTNQLVSAAGIRKEKPNNFEPSFNDEDFRTKYFATNTTQGLKYWKIGFLLIHTFTLGLLGPVVSVPLAIKQKKRLISVFATINMIGVWAFLIGISNTPDGGTLPTFPTIMFIVNYLGGFFLPLVLRVDPKSSPTT
jgi:serine/threonine protein kinase